MYHKCFNCSNVITVSERRTNYLGSKPNLSAALEKSICHCSKGFMIPNHILLHSVTYSDWEVMMDLADKNEVTIYTHVETALPFVRPTYGSKLVSSNIVMYTPNTKREKLETIME